MSWTNVSISVDTARRLVSSLRITSARSTRVSNSTDPSSMSLVMLPFRSASTSETESAFCRSVRIPASRDDTVRAAAATFFQGAADVGREIVHDLVEALDRVDDALLVGVSDGLGELVE